MARKKKIYIMLNRQITVVINSICYFRRVKIIKLLNRRGFVHFITFVGIFTIIFY